MTDTNGNVAADHLTTYQGVQVSIAILPDLRAAGDDFRADGYTFSIVQPWGGYRPYDIQGEMRADYFAHNYVRFNLAPPPSPPPAPAGSSRHGFGRAIDVASNAPVAVRDRILAKHGFHLWQVTDRNHYEWGNVLVAADVSSVPLNNSQKEQNTMYVKGSAAQIYAVFTDANGVERLRLAGTVEGQLATVRSEVTTCSDTQLSALGAECGWVGGANTPIPLPKVAVDLSGIKVPAPDLTPVLQAIAAGEAQDADAFKQILAAIGQAPANTLATFGLKRI